MELVKKQKCATHFFETKCQICLLKPKLTAFPWVNINHYREQMANSLLEK